MRVVKQILDSRTEWALQDLLIDVAAVVVATEPSRARTVNDPKRTEYAVSRKSPPTRQMWPTAGII
jgi:hypothetical protein